jgi:hypothetical protein
MELNLHQVSEIKLTERKGNLDPFKPADRNYQIFEVVVTLKGGNDFTIYMYGDEGVLVKTNMKI